MVILYFHYSKNYNSPY